MALPFGRPTLFLLKNQVVFLFEQTTHYTMKASPKNLRICPNGHRYYKSSECPVCPICESEKEVKEVFLAQLGAPARRALEGVGATTLEKLAVFTEKEILQLHGMGPASMPTLRKALEGKGLGFKK